MNKTRFLALCLSAALGASLTACGAPPAETPSPAPSQPTPAATASVRPGGEMVEIVAVDNANCLVRITGVDPRGKNGCTVDVALTNRAEKPILAALRYAAVNGVQTDPFFNVEVPVGETADGEITLNDPVLKAYGVTGYSDIELNFQVVDAADLTQELDENTSVHIYPDGEGGVKPYVRDEEDDELIFENEYLKAVLISYYQDRKTGFAANIHLTNKTDLPLNCTVDEPTLNGHACDPFFFVTVAPEKQMFTTIYWSPTFMAESGVDALFLAKGETDEPDEEIEEVRFRLRAYDAEGWNSADLVDEEITLELGGEKEEEPEALPGGPAQPSPAPAGPEG